MSCSCNHHQNQLIDAEHRCIRLQQQVDNLSMEKRNGLQTKVYEQQLQIDSLRRELEVHKASTAMLAELRDVLGDSGQDGILSVVKSMLATHTILDQTSQV